MKKPTPLKIVYVPIDDLVGDAGSLRHMEDVDLDTLTRGIKSFAMVVPVVVRRANNKIIDGHSRALAARRAGLKSVPVIYLDISGKRAKLLGLALNKLSGLWDEDALIHLLSELAADPDIDLSLSGFGEDELAHFLRRLEVEEKRDRLETFDLDAAFQNAATDVKKGDVFELGPHRLMCGNAGDSDDVALLIGDRKPRMLITDPPYNVKYGRHGGAGGAGRAILNDGLSPEEFEALMRAFVLNAMAHVNGAMYIFMSSKEWPLLAQVLNDAGAHWSDTVIWAKDSFVLGRADYHRQYEPIWYGWPEGKEHFWCGDRTQGDVWTIDRPTASPLHPTMKPVDLIERAIENSSEDADIVLDLFLGSGTTLIAAERTGRVCLGMELDPRYCSVILARWETFTGLKASKVGQSTGRRRHAR